MQNNNNYYGWLVHTDYEAQEYHIEDRRLPKFSDDKVYIDNKDIMLIIDGVIFNIKELIQEEQAASWTECVEAMAQKDETFFSRMRGSFNGILLDKHTGTFRVFVDHIGGHPIFYYQTEETAIYTSNFNYLAQLFREKNIKPTLNESAVEYMLAFGAMIDDSTYFKDVRRLLGGEYLEYKQNEKLFCRETYFDFDNENILLSEEQEIIEELEKKFKTAIEREFNKDEEYGYKSLVDISGGMDSRTVCFGAKKWGFKNVLNICMSQMNACERKVAEENVKLLGNDYVFTSLDNANFIYDIDEIVKLNYGLTYVASVTGALKNTKMLDMDRIGIHHTGILGDIHDGSFVGEVSNKLPDMSSNKYFMSHINDFKFENFDITQYKNQEMYLFKTRGILFGLTSNLIRQSVTETGSPFCDIDFLNTFFSISLEDRVNNKIMQKWVLRKYPEVNKVVYGNTGSKLDVNIYWRKIKSMFRRMGNNVLKPFMYKMHMPVDISPRNSMNPFEYWYSTIPEFRDFIEDYFVKNTDLLDHYPNVKNYCTKIYKEGKVVDKFLAMTVISVIKQYFKD